MKVLGVILKALAIFFGINVTYGCFRVFVDLLDLAIFPAARDGAVTGICYLIARALWRGGGRLMGDVQTRPGDEGSAVTCPHCGLVNPASALRCDCGYDFPAPQRPSG